MIHVLIRFGEIKVLVNMFDYFLLQICDPCEKDVWVSMFEDFVLKKIYDPHVKAFWRNKCVCDHV